MDKRDFGFSYPWGKAEITDFILPKLSSNANILDVGAGSGVYREYFGHNFIWTAIEVWPETAEYLKTIYNFVYQQDIRSFNYLKHYDLVIFGDVIEHLTIEDAQKVIKKAIENSNMVLIAVPYQLKQDEMYGNEAERHLQPDLTPKNFLERYPQFTLIHQVTRNKKPIYGYYFYEKENK